MTPAPTSSAGPWPSQAVAVDLAQEDPRGPGRWPHRRARRCFDPRHVPRLGDDWHCQGVGGGRSRRSDRSVGDAVESMVKRSIGCQGHGIGPPRPRWDARPDRWLSLRGPGHLLPVPRVRLVVTRPVVVLGATGSIGSQTIEVATSLGLDVAVLAARSPSAKLAELATAHPMARVMVAGGSSDRRAEFERLVGRPVEFGAEAVIDAARIPAPSWSTASWAQPG